jgi:hypothetical protein
MSERLSDFLIALATDSDRMSRYRDDPAGELERAGLTDEERAAVLARDSGLLRLALRAGPADTMTHILKKKPGGPPPGPPHRTGKRRAKPRRRAKGKGKGKGKGRG